MLCLDGTWNNAYTTHRRDDGKKVLKPSNPLKFARAVVPEAADGVSQVTYYHTGVGSMTRYPGLPNRLLMLSDRIFGGAVGAGFERNVEAAATFLTNNYRAGDQVFVLGFSRGAAEARALVNFLDWMGGIPTKGDAYFLPIFFREYVRTRGEGNPAEVKTERTGTRPGDLQPAAVVLLAVWDTVAALGRTTMRSRGFHVRDRPAGCVAHARQAIAVDERRAVFLPSIWKGPASPEQTLEQRWFAGVHSNVGGGYTYDGLANIPLHWFLDEAEKLGLEIDRSFIQPYYPFPQGQQYDSMTPAYWRINPLWGFRSGVRSLLGHPRAANLSLDPSVLDRIHSVPGVPERSRMKRPYRPKNVREYMIAEGRGAELPEGWR